MSLLDDSLGLLQQPRYTALAALSVNYKKSDVGLHCAGIVSIRSTDARSANRRAARLTYRKIKDPFPKGTAGLRSISL